MVNGANFLFKALSDSCYRKEGAMFTCAKEKVTFVIKITGIVCFLEVFRYLGGKPSHVSETFNERRVQKPPQQIRSGL